MVVTPTRRAPGAAPAMFTAASSAKTETMSAPRATGAPIGGQNPASTSTSAAAMPADASTAASQTNAPMTKPTNGPNAASA